MKFNDYFHTHYTTSREDEKGCVKVSVEAVGHGMFCATCENNGDLSFECHLYEARNRIRARHYEGENISGCVDNIFCLAYDWTGGGTEGSVKGYSKKEKACLRKCVMGLPDAFALLCGKTQLTDLEKKEVMGHIKLLQNLVSNTVSIAPFDAVRNGEAKGTVRWREVDLSTASMQDCVDLAVACLGEYGEPAEYGGMLYTASKDEHGAYILRYLAEDKPARTVAEVIAELQKLDENAKVACEIIAAV